MLNVRKKIKEQIMALIKCKECQTEISDKATVCIKCGCPWATNENTINKDKVLEYIKKPQLSYMYVCPSCGYIGKKEEKSHFNFIIFLILSIFFLIPGIIYAIWTSSIVDRFCPQCKNKNIIPINSEKGQELAIKAGSVKFENYLIKIGALEKKSS